jgi:hypothetical protein
MEKWLRPTQGKELVERRKHNRFKAENGCLAALFPQLTAVGQIVDIGRGGLAFRYVASQEPPTGSSQLQILVSDRSFCLKKVPFETVWDVAVPREFSHGPITLRHCGVRFGELTHSYEVNLGYFIQYHTSCGHWRTRNVHLHNEPGMAYAQAYACPRGSTPLTTSGASTRYLHIVKKEKGNCEVLSL